MSSHENNLPGGYLKRAEPPPAGTFDIGLVSAGAVSGGAFSAGVMDFLIEALIEPDHAILPAQRQHHFLTRRTFDFACFMSLSPLPSPL